MISNVLSMMEVFSVFNAVLKYDETKLRKAIFESKMNVLMTSQLVDTDFISKTFPIAVNNEQSYEI